MPVIPVTQEAEAGESLELGRWRLQGAQITQLYSSLGHRVRLCLKNKRNKTKNPSPVSFFYSKKGVKNGGQLKVPNLSPFLGATAQSI